MRFIINGLIALMLLGLLCGVMVYRTAEQHERSRHEAVRDDLRRLQREIMLQGTLKKVPVTDFGYPETVDPAWFKDDQPRNTLLSGVHPWLEIAHETDKALEHPREKIAASSKLAQFWYNPYTGRVRARIPASTSDAASLRLYNFINDANLPALFADAPGNARLDGQ